MFTSIKKTSKFNTSFFRDIFSRFFIDLAVDLGTANTRVHLKGKGIILNEPTVIARQEKGGRLVAIGKQAERMLGRTPKNIETSRPLKNGVISDFDMTQELLRYFVKRVQRAQTILPISLFSRMLIGIPAGVTEVERKAVVDAGLSSGVRRVFLVEETVASALGAGLSIDNAEVSLVMDIGAGTSEIAVLASGGVVVSKSIPIAGDVMDQHIVNWIREHHNILVGEKSAEKLKIRLGLGIKVSQDDAGDLLIRGRDLSSGLPKEVSMIPEEVREGLLPPVVQITELVRAMIEETPPELVADMVASGLTLTGGGALLSGLDIYLAESLHIPVRVAESADLCVIKGLAIILDNQDLLDQLQVAWGR